MTQDEYDIEQEYYETECCFADFDPTVPMPEEPPFDPDEEYPFSEDDEMFDGEEYPPENYYEHDYSGNYDPYYF